MIIWNILLDATYGKRMDFILSHKSHTSIQPLDKLFEEEPIPNDIVIDFY